MRDIAGFRHPLVRALAWLIASPPLFAAEASPEPDVVVDGAWCAQAFKEAAPWLAALEAAPAALEAHVAARRITRLGRLAEALIGYWLRHSPRFELLLEGQAVHDGGRTLGDFDFVFLDRASGEQVHWELAVKFYLRRPGFAGFEGYQGPTGVDVLAHKAGRIFSRQLALAHTPAGAAVLEAAGARSVKARAFVKGRLFHPADATVLSSGINPDHAKGWWRRAGEPDVRHQFDGGVYRVIERMEWLAAPERRDAAPCVSATHLETCAAQAFSAGASALMVAEFSADAANMTERARGMLVPADWGGTASWRGF